ncbi:hypothetical protein CC78DRAFT_210696 [Lojkania enalia]|uniref:Zn(2)-C6 fungal-type domain-containing protein n=1 Tax=Lojkania enalia TaxID=147567 RepID=A0A9P4K9E2_9PLEO|nr:hypothetical protein CC78DRAFT_210696 [Didymosphaeria enalia]
MEENENPSVERPAHTRTLQACQRCRSLKTRCLPSERPGYCKRCYSAKRECLWAEQPRRPKRTRGPSRIAQVEQKIDGLVASLVPSESSRPTATGARPPPGVENEASQETTTETRSLDRTVYPGSWLPFPNSFEEHPSHNEQDEDRSHKYIEKLRLIHSFGEDADLSRPANFQFPTQLDPVIENDLVKGLLQIGQADSLLDEYRAMSVSSPFVPIAPSTSAQELSVSKPMLLLSILTVASWRDHQRQMSLDELYRTEVASRTIIRPRRTLSLIQSIVVYLSWYHFVFSHKTQQTISLVQLAIGLAIDLGLHQKIKRPFTDFPGRPKQQPVSTKEQRERQRTLLGLYHLSTTLSGGLGKPNLLRYSDYIGECAKRLQVDLEFSSDALIGNLTPLRRIDDQIHDMFYTDDTLDLPFTDSRISLNIRFLEAQIEEWRRNNSNEEFNRTLDLSYHFAKIELYATALRQSPPLSPPQATNSSAQINALLSALEAGKCFFDRLLEIPVSEYHLVSFSEWMRLPFVIITISKLCIPNETYKTLQWDPKIAQERVRLELYLESLCYRMQGLATFDKVKQPHPDYWTAMKMIMDLTRAWYCRRIQEKNDSSARSGQALPTPDTLRNFNQNVAESSSELDSTTSVNGNIYFPHATLGATDIGVEAVDPNLGDDPFAFMRNMDFDMEQFLDIGIWGSDGYEAMAFGGGNM